MFKIWYEKRSSSEKYGKFELVLAVYGSDVDVSLICIFVDNDSLYGNVGQCNLVVIFSRQTAENV